jgi:hypothetical protein
MRDFEDTDFESFDYWFEHRGRLRNSASLFSRFKAVFLSANRQKSSFTQPASCLAGNGGSFRDSKARVACR